MKSIPARGFRDRQEAGRVLAGLLAEFRGDRGALVLALPRGGVPVAAVIAGALDLPLDVLVVRKLGVPGHEELAMGAIAGGVRVLNEEMAGHLHLRAEDVEAVTRRETAELARREALYRKDRPAPQVADRTVIVVDDGIATGSTMSAAIGLLRRQGARRIVVAVPVAPGETVARLSAEADRVVVPLQPEPFVAVSRWYEDFSQTSDDEVRCLLGGGCPGHASAAPSSAVSGGNVLEAIRGRARPLTGAADDHDELLEIIGEASIVFLGGASHGTHEFYRQRARITRRLILEKGFNAVAAEADWPDSCRVNRYVRGESDDLDSVDALAGFERFPSWMWRNADVLDFVGWLRDHNENVWSSDRQVGFYGLDLYSLHKSMNEVIACLERTDPREADKARILFGCIDRFGRDPQNYGLLAGPGVSDACRAAVIRNLVALREREVEDLSKTGGTTADGEFFTAQNERLARNAESYYRKMFRSYVSSWNLRDEHMMELLVELIAHLQSSCGSAKVVVWAHNSHVGDARATEMSWRGELNLGQLARAAFPGQCRLIGFTTYAGSVTAASGWRLPAERKQMRPGLDGSIEKLFHQVGIPNFMLDLTKENSTTRMLAKPRLQRAVGVVYLPDGERHTHYFEACLAGQFDAVLHYDLTRAVEPLERSAPPCSAMSPAHAARTPEIRLATPS